MTRASHPPVVRSGRRRFLADAAAASASLSVLEWLGFFRDHGVPGTAKDWGLASARAAEETPADDRFLVYWFAEGGWDSYSLFSPVHTPNHSALSIPANTLYPSPPWSQQFYRAQGYGVSPSLPPPSTVSGIEHGYLAAPGRSLLADMAVVSSHRGNLFHSGGRFDCHYGMYTRSLNAQRQPDERTVLQAFCEAKGANFLLPHVSWHRWLADGELDLGQYPEGTGYYEKLGPAYAHTIYGRTPRDLKARLGSLGDLATQSRRRLLRSYTDDLHARFLADRDGPSVRAFSSALSIHRQLADRGAVFNLNTLFDDPDLRAEFGVRDGDDQTTATVVNGMPARSKDTPHIRVQTMMAYELMRAKISCGLWLENREVRGFDSHRGRRDVLDADSNSDQRTVIADEIWNPLSRFVARLKSTEMPGAPGVSMYDRTTIVLCSEMGRAISGNVDAILANTALPDDVRYAQILDQDVCQHWHVNGVAFLGGNVRGGTQFGRVGSETLESIPTMPDGTLDPAFDPGTGQLRPGQQKSAASFVSDPGHVYATALALSGVSPAGRGRNTRPALPFVQR
ncbi:MAG: hypothetical protein FJ137_11925 [Deltaproteobacteria bacterium]|nr:hypothetical protein [Deltaproteobacteria bacterium]